MSEKPAPAALRAIESALRDCAAGLERRPWSSMVLMAGDAVAVIDQERAAREDMDATIAEWSRSYRVLGEKCDRHENEAEAIQRSYDRIKDAHEDKDKRIVELQKQLKRSQRQHEYWEREAIRFKDAWLDDRPKTEPKRPKENQCDS